MTTLVFRGGLELCPLIYGGYVFFAANLGGGQYFVAEGPDFEVPPPQGVFGSFPKRLGIAGQQLDTKQPPTLLGTFPKFDNLIFLKAPVSIL